MDIKKVMYVEDNVMKYMSVVRLLKKIGVWDIKHANNSVEALKFVDTEKFDLIILDMHFQFDGKDDIQAGEKTMKCIREKGIKTPIIFCSSRNWKIPGTLGNIFYNERRNWECEAQELFQCLRSIIGNDREKIMNNIKAKV